MTTASETAPAAQSAAAPPVLDPRRRNIVFATIVLGLLLAALDQTIVGTALPTIVSDLGGAAHMSWVVTAYLLAETVATVLVGKFGDLCYLTGDGRLFTHTAAGSREAAAITDTWARWLGERLDEHGARPDDRQLRAAVDVIAKRLLAEDLAQQLSPEKVLAGAAD